MTRDEIFERIAEILADSFELDRAEIKPESTLYEDLDLDSIDAIDLSVRLEEKTGLSFKEEDLKSIRTLQDVVDFIAQRLV